MEPDVESGSPPAHATGPRARRARGLPPASRPDLLGVRADTGTAQPLALRRDEREDRVREVLVERDLRDLGDEVLLPLERVREAEEDADLAVHLELLLSNRLVRLVAQLPR